MREADITVVSLSGIYEHEGFHRNREGLRFIDCTDIRGTNGYCDAAAEEALKVRVGMMSSSDDNTGDGSTVQCINAQRTAPLCCLHFIDHGNYHYLSKLNTDALREPFHLVVFDHHTDMQEPAFGGLLSCGSWVKDVLETNPYVRGVTLIGPIDTEDRPSVLSEYPLYISLDKDVLSPTEVLTNWDQGSMTTDELFAHLDDLFAHHRILGIDVCGDAAPDMDPALLSRAIEMNDAFNRRFLEYYEKILRFRLG